MKVFALFVLLAFVACASAEGESLNREEFLSHADEFVGELQESEDAAVESIGSFSSEGSSDESGSLPAPPGALFGIPSCKLGFKIGTPICIAKCISRGHIAGYCSGSKCNCVG